MTKPGKTTMTESEARALVNQYRSTLAATLDDDALIAEVRRRCASQAFNARLGDEVYGRPCENIRLAQELEVVGAELAEERQAYDDLRDVLERVKQERSAVAAHVAVLESIINGSSLTDSPHVMSALNSAPATSLASLKAQWVEEMLRTLPYKELHTNNGDLREDARYRDGWNTFRDYLRRQAEEADDDNE